MASVSSTDKKSGALPGNEVYVSGFASRPALPRRLHAGPLSLCFDAGGLRWVCRENAEILRGIYVAVRDENWGTVPGQLHDLQIREDGESFQITFRSEHQRNEIDFFWRAIIEGRRDGSMTFSMAGEARTTFRRNRIGFCVLHPMGECAGARCRARHSNGLVEPLRFPAVIAAEQPMTGFCDLQAMAYEIAPDIWAELLFEGDVFETEDQRNWIDASFKTYCTPLGLPRPVIIEAGTKIRQRITLRMLKAPAELEARWPRAKDSGEKFDAGVPLQTGFHQNEHRRRNGLPAGRSGEDVRVEVDLSKCAPLPGLGLQASIAAGTPDSEFEKHITRLRMLGLAHLRCDVRLANLDWRQVFLAASREAGALGVPLELAIHLPANPTAASSRLDDLTVLIREMPDRGPNWRGVKRILALQDGQMSTTRAALQRVRSQLNWMSVPIGAGTDADLYQFNLQRPPGGEADFVFWSMNPQVHAFDNASIAETPAAAAEQVRSVREYFPGKPVSVTPVTVKPRFNPVALQPEAPVRQGELPASVDVRQLSLFGAGWTLAMIKALSEAGAESVTLYETAGARGVLESEGGTAFAGLFPSLGGGVFPLFHVLADVANFQQIAATCSSQPSRVEALSLLQGANCGSILVGNLGGERVRVNLTLPAAVGELRILNELNVREAMLNPEAWRQRPGMPLPVGGKIWLPPYALARLNFSLHNKQHEEDEQPGEKYCGRIAGQQRL